MRTLFAIPVLLCMLTVSRAAEFDLDSGRVVLRQLQYCVDCGSALLVTRVRPGVPVRCPDCGKEQPRLSPEYLLTQMYQLCKVCQGPLSPEGRRPGEVVECGLCHARQPLVRDVFLRGEQADGLGYVPGFPPGTGKKTLLLSPDRPDAAITMIPLDTLDGTLGDGGSDVPLPPEISATAEPAARRIPEPPEGMLGRVESSPPSSPEQAASGSGILSGEYAAIAPSSGTGESRGAVNVPSVTADLFGAGQAAASSVSPAPGGSERAASGIVAARVNGEPIYAHEVDRIVLPVMKRLRAQADPAEAEAVVAREKSLGREVLERLIDRELAVKEAAAIGYKPDPSAVRARESELAEVLAGTGMDIRREAVRDVTMTDMRKRYGEKPGAATPSAVREFYARHKDEMIRPRAIALDQLVVYADRLGKPDARNFRDIALEISGLLESGEKFDALRDRYDEFLPAAGVERMEPALRPVGAYARQVTLAGGELRKGAVFGPLFMEGMAVFGKVSDERPEGPVPFAEVEGEIRRRLESEAADKNLESWLLRLRGKARIEIVE